MAKQSDSTVGVVGVGQTQYVERDNRELTELIFEATSLALAMAGIDRDAIESVVLAAYDLTDGRSISNMLTATAAGAYLKDEIRVADGGIYGAILGYLRVVSGEFKNSLVVSCCKCSEAPLDQVTNLNFDPFYHRHGLNETIMLAMQANSYIREYGISADLAAKIVVKNRTNGMDNRLAHLKKGVSVAEVLNSPSVAMPLKVLDLPPRSDGACAVVLARADEVRSLSRRPAWIRGVGWSISSYYPGNLKLSDMGSLAEAATKAYRMAGITNPVSEIDVCEIQELSSFHELMSYSALGFCKPGQEGRLLESGDLFGQGKLPVNPSGGMLSSNPYSASGLARFAEAALQVIGSAGEHQISNVSLALAQGSTGLAGQGNCVFILGTD